jgi:hypothetical protein
MSSHNLFNIFVEEWCADVVDADRDTVRIGQVSLLTLCEATRVGQCKQHQLTAKKCVNLSLAFFLSDVRDFSNIRSDEEGT